MPISNVVTIKYYGSGQRFMLSKIDLGAGRSEWIGQDTQTIDPATGEPKIVARQGRLAAAVDQCFATLTPDDLAKPYR